LEYRVTSWSSVAPSTSTRPRISSHRSAARSRTVSNVSESGISSHRFFLACARLISEVAMRMVTTVGPVVSGLNFR
jgi:hypothetical protein